ncbi:uncharacterized protein N0V89_007524 [Didymosphaeria variabile]|uniref:Zn(2)-C6 fungal-type domain-containing protein n=1 Tax=Didymosphaeria variabile TaxID=1932322 RepID=A0A9W8XJP1_9PLEO|nr:uncharacterized protein N0V89_007524 [Didymosphaeria variabile]KAJ4352177.1 hypothetical protein N0V89_007524 [Didymosphaeria variabile]
MEIHTAADAAKVAIPRQPRPGPPEPPDEQDVSQPTPRAGRACLSCRKRKVKCSGDTPRCAGCIANNLDCLYDQARRDRLKSATNKNKDLVLLLRELSLRQNLDQSDKARIQDALQGYEDDSSSTVSVRTLKRRKLSVPEELEKEDNQYSSIAHHARAEEGLARLDEDLLRSRKSRSTGYVGQGAGVHWLRSLQDQEKTEGPDQQTISDTSNAITTLEYASPRKTKPAIPVTEASFYLDSDSSDLEMDVNPYDLPPQEVTEKLLECYMRTVHKSFPILPPQFEDQFRRYFQAVNSQRPFSVPDKWLAILNIVFAIGARYSHLINAEWQGEDCDHLVYMTRTVRLLGPWPFAAAPDLALIQVSGLLAFYYQVIGRVSRGWVMIGIAIRLALALGLHLRNEDPKTPVGKKEITLRTWWSLHAIECQLSAITGRPCVLGHEDCTVSLPMTFAEEVSTSNSPAGSTPSIREQDKSATPASNSNAGKSRRQAPRSYLDAHLNIGLITQKLLAALYSPRTAQYSWAYVQNTIPNLLQELDDWKHGALPDNGSLHTQMFPPPEGSRESLLLRFYYLSTKILITRPCLCRSGRKIRDQSDVSATFDQRMARTCVRAALALAGLLSIDSSPEILYENGPWWSIVHNIMQAMAVLLLELSYEQNHMQGSQVDVKNSVKRLFHWLNAMRHTDAVVERAHKVIVKIIQQQRFQTIFSELLIDNEPAHIKNEHVAPSFGHPRQEPPTYPDSGHVPQLQPNQWYGGYVASNNRPGSGSFSQATAGPQLLAGLERSQAHQQLLPQMNQLHSQPEQYQYLEDPYSNQFMFSNPFITSYDQDAPFVLTLDDLWSRTEPSGHGAFAEQQGVNYPNYSYTMDHNPQGSSR